MSNRRSENNERIKRRYLEWRKHARRLSEQSLDKEISAIERFDAWNRRKEFRMIFARRGGATARWRRSALSLPVIPGHGAAPFVRSDCPCRCFTG